MCHKILLIVLVSIFTISCGKKSTISLFPDTIDTTRIVQGRPVDLINSKIFSIDKAQFRLDYDGNLRSLSAQLGIQVDTSIVLTVNSTFGKKVAGIQFTPQEILFIDNQETNGFQLDYLTLSQYLGVPLGFKDIENLFLANYNSLATNEVDSISILNHLGLLSITSISLPIIDTFYRYEVRHYSRDTYNILSRQIISNNTNKKVIANYTWRERFSTTLPRSVDLTFEFDETPIIFEIEYRSVILDSLATFNVDSTLIIEPVYYSK